MVLYHDPKAAAAGRNGHMNGHIPGMPYSSGGGDGDVAVVQSCSSGVPPGTVAASGGGPGGRAGAAASLGDSAKATVGPSGPVDVPPGHNGVELLTAGGGGLAHTHAHIHTHNSGGGGGTTYGRSLVGEVVDDGGGGVGLLCASEGTTRSSSSKNNATHIMLNGGHIGRNSVILRTDKVPCDLHLPTKVSACTTTTPTSQYQDHTPYSLPSPTDHKRRLKTFARHDSAVLLSGSETDPTEDDPVIDGDGGGADHNGSTSSIGDRSPPYQIQPRAHTYHRRRYVEEKATSTEDNGHFQRQRKDMSVQVDTMPLLSGTEEAGVSTEDILSDDEDDDRPLPPPPPPIAQDPLVVIRPSSSKSCSVSLLTSKPSTSTAVNPDRISLLTEEEEQEEATTTTTTTAQNQTVIVSQIERSAPLNTDRCQAHVEIRTMREGDAEFAGRLMVESFRRKFQSAVGRSGMNNVTRAETLCYRRIKDMYYSTLLVLHKGERAGIIALKFHGDNTADRDYTAYCGEVGCLGTCRIYWWWLFWGEWVNPSECYIDHIFIEERFRGQGLGTMLLERAEQEAKCRGCRYMTLWVPRANARAKCLYERHGYRTEVTDSSCCYSCCTGGYRHWFRMVKTIKPK